MIKKKMSKDGTNHKDDLKTLLKPLCLKISNAKLLKTATAMLIPTPTVKHSILLLLRKQRGNKGIAGRSEPAGNEFRGSNAITHEQIFLISKIKSDRLFLDVRT